MALAPGRGMSASARPLARAAAAAAARGSARGRFRLRLRPRAAPACEGGAGRASGAPEAGEGPSSVRGGGSGGGAVARPGSPSATAIKSGRAGASGALAARSAPRDEMSVAGAVALITGTTIGALLSRHGARAARRGAARRNGGGKKSALFGALSLASAAPAARAPSSPLRARWLRAGGAYWRTGGAHCSSGALRAGCWASGRVSTPSPFVPTVCQTCTFGASSEAEGRRALADRGPLPPRP